MLYDTWDVETGEWKGEHATITDALRSIYKGEPLLVTERTPLGDPRISLVEDIASGWYRNRPINLRDLKWVNEAKRRLKEAKEYATQLPALTRTFSY